MTKVYDDKDQKIYKLHNDEVSWHVLRSSHGKAIFAQKHSIN